MCVPRPSKRGLNRLHKISGTYQFPAYSFPQAESHHCGSHTNTQNAGSSSVAVQHWQPAMLSSPRRGIIQQHTPQETTVHVQSHPACIPPTVSVQNLRPTDNQAASREQAGVAIPQHSLQSPGVQHTMDEMHERMSSKKASHNGCSLTSTQIMSKKRASCMVSGPECRTQTAGGIKRTRCNPISVPGTKAVFVVPQQHVAPRPSGGFENAAKYSPTYRGEV